MTYDGGGWAPGAAPAATSGSAAAPAGAGGPAGAPPGYPGYPGYPNYPVYPGYPPYGYYGYPPPPASGPPAFKPGVIPLRPLTLSEIFNGAIAYIRTNLKATLGLTVVVVVAAQVLTVILQAGPLLTTGDPKVLTGEGVSNEALLASSAAGLAGMAASALAQIVLSGMLTVVIGRAVFGSSITVGEAWRRVRGRLLALLALTLLEAVGAVVIMVAAVALVAGVAYGVNGAAAVLVGVPLALGTIALLAYLGTMLSFAAPVIVLERLGVFSAIRRSFALARRGFWRILGIRLLGSFVASIIAGAVAAPFAFGGQIMMLAAESTTMALIALVLQSVGNAIGQIVTAPFSAGVVVLLYTDYRIRAEAFDLVLLTGATPSPAAAADSTDHLWLTRQR